MNEYQVFSRIFLYHSWFSLFYEEISAAFVHIFPGIRNYLFIFPILLPWLPLTKELGDPPLPRLGIARKNPPYKDITLL